MVPTAFGLAILANLRFLGALLVGSLIIIPASAARQLTHSLNAFLITSAAISVLAMLVGFAVAAHYGLDSAPLRRDRRRALCVKFAEEKEVGNADLRTEPEDDRKFQLR